MPFKKGQVAWNRGLTKETDERVKKYALNISGIPKTTEHKKKLRIWAKSRIGKKGANWQGGKKRITMYGYVLIYSPNHPNRDKNTRCVLEHRLVVEKFIGRYLTKEEVVHHINENKSDNRIENLMLFKNLKEHSSFHSKIKQFGITNPIKRQIKNRWNHIKLILNKNGKET